MRRIALCAVVLTLAGCSVKKYAINRLGDALAGTGSTFSSDDDLELIRDAVPFSLKLIESLLAESPKHKGLLLAAASGFTQYSYAFVQTDADEIADRDPKAAQNLRDRAKRLYLRARNYGMRGLELKHPGFAAELKAAPEAAAAKLNKDDVPYAYWTAISWAAALVVSRDMFMIGQIPQFEALIERSLLLDETYNDGVIHSFLITYDMSRLRPKADSFDQTAAKSLEEKIANATHHYARALELAKGSQAGLYVTYAESVMTAKKDRAGFEKLLNQALRVDVDKAPELRLLNLVMQRRARFLLARTEKLFPKP
ncbi:MAG: TRAP transporter TatT component family protein [Bryobacteraceae bacterium]